MFAKDRLRFDSATGTLVRIGANGYATALTTAVAGPQTTLEMVSLGAKGVNDTFWGLVRSAAHLPKGYTYNQPGVYLLRSNDGHLLGPDEKPQQNLAKVISAQANLKTGLIRYI